MTAASGPRPPRIPAHEAIPPSTTPLPVLDERDASLPAEELGPMPGSGDPVPLRPSRLFHATGAFLGLGPCLSPDGALSEASSGLHWRASSVPPLLPPPLPSHRGHRSGHALVHRSMATPTTPAAPTLVPPGDTASLPPPLHPPSLRSATTSGGVTDSVPTISSFADPQRASFPPRAGPSSHHAGSVPCGPVAFGGLGHVLVDHGRGKPRSTAPRSESALDTP